MEKYNLKFIWLETSLAVCLNQQVGRRSVPLTDFFFWPQTDAWNSLKIYLENSKFISESERANILNEIGEVINSWQSKTAQPFKSIEKLSEKYPSTIFLTSY
jgi:hypothetical protein